MIPNTNNDVDTYISIKDLKRRFAIYVGYKPDFGAFYVTRCLFAVIVDGAAWIKATAFALQFSLTPLTLSLDIAALLVVGALWLVKKIIELAITLIFNVITTLFSTVIKSYIGTTLKIVAILVVALYCYLDWDFVCYAVAWLISERKSLMYNTVSGS
jgi:hypothetical protein